MSKGYYSVIITVQLDLWIILLVPKIKMKKAKQLDGQIEVMRMLKESSNIIINFSSRRTQVPEIIEKKEISNYDMNRI